MINWDVSKDDNKIIQQIAKRAVRLATEKGGWNYDFVDCCMDLTATHANGNPLKLRELLKADDYNFAHDVFGIKRKLDRTTGQLLHGFLPRYSKPDIKVKEVA